MGPNGTFGGNFLVSLSRGRCCFVLFLYISCGNTKEVRSPVIARSEVNDEQYCNKDLNLKIEIRVHDKNIVVLWVIQLFGRGQRRFYVASLEVVKNFKLFVIK